MGRKRDTGQQGLRKRNGGRIFTGMVESPVAIFPAPPVALYDEYDRGKKSPAVLSESSREDRI